MGSERKTTETSNQSSSGTSTVDFKPMSGTEQQILNQFRQYGDQQLSFLNDLVRGGTSPFQLNAADQSQLDRQYQSAFDKFMQGEKDYTDYLSSTRGLNKSDSPIADQAIQRYGLGMSDLLSQKANAGLNLGLQSTGLRLQGSQILPAGLQAAFNPLYQERMMSPTQTTTGNSRGFGQTVYNPSMMDNIGQGIGLAKAGLGLGAGIGSMFTPAGGLGPSVMPVGF